MAEYKVLEPCFINSRLYSAGEIVTAEYDKTPSFLEIIPEELPIPKKEKKEKEVIKG